VLEERLDAVAEPVAAVVRDDDDVHERQRPAHRDGP
jgi:hypothetical protein